VSRGPESDYDAFAAAYAQDNERNPWNAHYERRAVLRLVGDAAARRVFDAGCGAGAPSVAIVDPDAWTQLTTEPRFIFFSATPRGSVT
jgi:hypothetical protein